MDRPTTPKKPVRPRFGRSYSAAAELSPPRPQPERVSTTATQLAAKKLHLPIPHTSDREKRRSERVAQAVADYSPVAAVSEKIQSHTRSDSRQQLTNQAFAESPAPAADTEAAPAKLPARRVSPNDVAKERLRRSKRNEELQSTMEGLSGLARESTRQVDALYYSLLEKATTLRSTISGLQALSTDSRQLLSDFEKDAGLVNRDLGEHVAAFKGFQGQQRRVAALEGRIKQGMDKTDSLSERLEVARKRVELWEKRENEWQARTNTRLRVGWGIFLAIAAVILALVGIRRYYIASSRLQPKPIGPMTGINDTLLDQMRHDFNADLDAASPPKPLRMDPINTDRRVRRLRILDEL